MLTTFAIVFATNGVCYCILHQWLLCHLHVVIILWFVCFPAACQSMLTYTGSCQSGESGACLLIC